MKRILIAEDNDSNYVLMTYILKGHYDYDRARNGEEAVEKVQRGHFDLVLMDLKMPMMDGLEATRKIRALFPAIPVVALTANVFDVDRQNAAKAGCIEFLQKPINRETCLDTIRRLLS
ncbi:MAG: response regulator [Prevotella sp.]|nr:response regulator [Prevotella sp.]